MSFKIQIEESIELLQQLIRIPSLSKGEEQAANHLRGFLSKHGISYESLLNNTICRNKYWQTDKPVILLNSHIDTVKPVSGWTADPFGGELIDGQLTGLGSNDAGASLVSLLAVFRYFNEQKNLPFNLIFAATAEEENSGFDGIAQVVKVLGRVDLAIVGEPTKMELAIAEKGLVVIDCVVHGKAGHAARNEGVNAIYLANQIIQEIRNYKFEKVSDLLGEVKMTVTQIDAGYQHNIVPDTCKMVVDVRTNECYSNSEVVEIITNLLDCDVTARSLRLNSSGISSDHPFVKRAQSLGINCYGSPTLSDQAQMPYTSLKMGPGDSARSHTADEYILVDEIKAGVARYIEMLSGLEL